MNPMVSVVVATYKQENSLMDALNSLANQTYNNFEIVLVDDNGNEDWTVKVRAIVEAFRKEYINIQIQHIENTSNQGSAKARNIGIKVSKGEYVTFLDDDDVYLPRKIEHQVTKMIEESADYSITDLYLYNDDNKLIDKRIRTYIQSATQQALMKYHLMYHMTGTDSMMYKKDYLLSIGAFDEIDLGDEFYLMQKAVSSGGKFCYVPGCYIKAYVHVGEMGLSSGQSKIKCENELHEYKKKYFAQIDKKTKKYILMRHYAVLSFAYIRMKQPVKFFINGVMSFITSPIQCVKLLMSKKI